MRRGELSNTILPRVYVVFEDLIGVLPDAKSRIAYNLAAKRKKWAQAIDYYQLTPTISQGIRDLYWRHHFRVDVITFIDPGAVSPIRERLDSRNLFFGDVLYYDRDLLLSELTYDPAILAVFDPEPSRILTWGSKGRYCTSDQLNLAKILF